MKVIETKIPGVVIIEPRVYYDGRGFFMETWNRSRYNGAGLPQEFVQDNLSFSTSGVLRGLHFQYPKTQGKLVSVLEGEIFDVAVDTRIGSPTFGQWLSVTLSADNKRQLYIPEGFAHGFYVNENALVCYKCTKEYDPDTECGIHWQDNEIGIDWPDSTPILSGKDNSWSKLREIPNHRLPQYRVEPGA